MLNAFKSPQTVALVGAGSEIGNEIINHLNQENLKRVILASRDGLAQYKDIGISVKSEFSTAKGRALLLQNIFAHGDVDVAIVAIGVLNGTREEITNINYTASVDLIAQISERMQTQGHGKILAISSFAQTRPRLDNYLYGSSKAGLDFFVRGLAENLQGSGVSISLLRPGFVYTKMTAGMIPPPFSINLPKVGLIGAEAIEGRKLIVNAPHILGIIAKLFQYIPRVIFRKLNS